MKEGDIQDFVIFAIKARQSKDMVREGWKLKGITNPESIADHNFSTTVLIITLYINYPELTRGLNQQKMLELSLIHDLGVIGFKDVITERGKSISNTRALDEKNKGERRKFSDLIGGLPNAQHTLTLWQEYSQQQTPESQFVKQVEKLDMVLQALHYEEQGCEPADLNEFWENAEKYLEGKDLEPVFRELQKIRGNK